jgi:hypothetical protein
VLSSSCPAALRTLNEVHMPCPPRLKTALRPLLHAPAPRCPSRRVPDPATKLASPASLSTERHADEPLDQPFQEGLICVLV